MEDGFPCPQLHVSNLLQTCSKAAAHFSAKTKSIRDSNNQSFISENGPNKKPN